MNTRLNAAVVTIALGLGFPTNAEVLDIASQELSEITRAIYINSDTLPDGRAFTFLAHQLGSIDRELAIAILHEGMQIDETAAADLINRLLSVHENARRNVDRAILNLGCYARVPVAYGDSVYGMLDVFDDIDDVIVEAHLAKLSQELDPDMSEKLLSWIQSQKTNISSISFDHKKQFELRGIDGDAILSDICIRLSNNDSGDAK